MLTFEHECMNKCRFAEMNYMNKCILLRMNEGKFMCMIKKQDIDRK